MVKHQNVGKQDAKKCNEDLKLGFDNEVKTLVKIKQKFKNTEKTKNMFNHFDFRNDDLKIDFELKTRRITHKQYPTIFFAKHKLETGRRRKAEGKTDRIIYLFSFLRKNDKTRRILYYWEDMGTDEDFFISECGNFARGGKAKPLVNVDMTKLKQFKYIV